MEWEVVDWVQGGKCGRRKIGDGKEIQHAFYCFVVPKGVA